MSLQLQYVIIYHLAETTFLNGMYRRLGRLFQAKLMLDQEIICESCMAVANKQLVSVQYLSVERWRWVSLSAFKA